MDMMLRKYQKNMIFPGGTCLGGEKMVAKGKKVEEDQQTLKWRTFCTTK